MDFYPGVRVARIAILVAAGILLLWAARRRPLSRRSRVVLVVLAAAALASYPNFGFFHARWGAIHYWDAYHYFIGAKYLPELGYAGLYEATLVGGRELGEFASVSHIRDLATYEARAATAVDADAVRRRFSPERWAAFKRDLAYFIPRVALWPGPFLDHGYNDPPPRALMLHVLVREMPANTLSLAILTSIDYVLILAGVAAVWWAFGQVAALLTLVCLAAGFFARFDFVGGSIVRWDWTVALLGGVAALARGRGATAGVLLGYAALARLFPVVFLAPLAAKLLQRPRDRVVIRCLVAAAALAALAGLALTVAEIRTGIVRDYAEKITVHQTAPSTNRVGLAALLTVRRAPAHFTPEGRMAVTQAALMAARPSPWIPVAAVAAYVLVAWPLVRRASPAESVMYAVPLIYLALSPTAYYYAFLVLLVVLPWKAGAMDGIRIVEMALLALNTAVSYVFLLTADGYLSLFYQVSIQMGIFFGLWLLLEYVRCLGGRAD